jgi:hypothetical protein
MGSWGAGDGLSARNTRCGRGSGGCGEGDGADERGPLVRERRGARGQGGDADRAVPSGREKRGRRGLSWVERLRGEWATTCFSFFFYFLLDSNSNMPQTQIETPQAYASNKSKVGGSA